VQVKGNAFVKEAPTHRKFYLFEKSDTKVHFIAGAYTSDIPYCDTFHIEEEWMIVSPDPSTQSKIQSCAVRISFAIIWHKSTMMKRIIQSSSESEVKANLIDWTDKMVKDKKNLFVEKKRPAKGRKGGFKVEASKKMQNIAQRIAERQNKQVEEKKEEDDKFNEMEF